MNKHFLNKIFFTALCVFSITSSTQTSLSDYRIVRYGKKTALIVWHSTQTLMGTLVVYDAFMSEDNIVSNDSKGNRFVVIPLAGCMSGTLLNAGLKGLYKELEIEVALKLAREKIRNKTS